MGSMLVMCDEIALRLVYHNVDPIPCSTLLALSAPFWPSSRGSVYASLLRRCLLPNFPKRFLGFLVCLVNRNAPPPGFL
jgi:hypothetical protein